jgi:hypothetical protein
MRFALRRANGDWFVGHLFLSDLPQINAEPETSKNNGFLRKWPHHIHFRDDRGKGPHPMNPVARKPVLRKLDEAELLMLVAAAEFSVHGKIPDF